MVRTSAPDRTGSKEDANLYLLAFWGLVKCGYPFRVAEDTRSEDGVEAGDGHKPGKEEVSAGSQPSDTLPKRIVQLMIDDVLYTCEEERLAARFGSEFVSAILDAQPLPVDSDKNEDDDFNLPFARFDEDKRKSTGLQPERNLFPRKHRMNLLTASLMSSRTAGSLMICRAGKNMTRSSLTIMILRWRLTMGQARHFLQSCILYIWIWMIPLPPISCA